MSRRTWIGRLFRSPFVLIVVAAALLALVLWMLYAPPGSGRTVYTMAAVEQGNIERSISSSGSVQALVTVEVGSQLSGQVAEIHKDFNDEVEEGELLALIDPATFETRVTAAEADLAVARSNVRIAEATVAKTKAQTALAEREASRQERLAERGNVSQSALDAARTALRAARADTEVAAAQLENARSVVAQREATLAQSRIDLERTRIVSPIEGVIIERSVSVGQTVAASLQAPVLFRIAQDLSQIQIEAEINEADIGAVSAGNSVTFTVDAYPEERFRGEVKQVRLAPTAELNIVTYTVIISASNRNRRLLPGMTATVRIVTGLREGVLKVPNEALRFAPPDDALRQAASDDARERQRAALFSELESALSLTGDQMRAVNERLAELRQRRQSSRRPFGGSRQRSEGFGGGRNGIPRYIVRVLDDILTADQKEKFQSLQRRLEDTRVADLWVLEARRPVPRVVRLGLSDGVATEIVGGLEAGDKVIIRARTEKQG